MMSKWNRLKLSREIMKAYRISFGEDKLWANRRSILLPLGFCSYKDETEKIR